MRNLAIIIAILGVTACGSRTQASIPDPGGQKEITRLDCLVHELQQKNAAQEERIKVLEDDLENVISYLNQQGY